MITQTPPFFLRIHLIHYHRFPLCVEFHTIGVKLPYLVSYRSLSPLSLFEANTLARQSVLETLPFWYILFISFFSINYYLRFLIKKWRASQKSGKCRKSLLGLNFSLHELKSIGRLDKSCNSLVKETILREHRLHEPTVSDVVEARRG